MRPLSNEPNWRSAPDVTRRRPAAVSLLHLLAVQVHSGGGGLFDEAVMTTVRDLCKAVGAALEIAGDRSGNRRQYQWRCCWRGSERAGEGSLRAYQIRARRKTRAHRTRRTARQAQYRQNHNIGSDANHTAGCSNVRNIASRSASSRGRSTTGTAYAGHWCTATAKKAESTRT